MNTITEAVGRESYPGRGIIIGRSAEGTHAVCAYFIMGRSENSRNRVFVACGDGLRTRAHDPSKVADPSLIIYAPVRVYQNHTIITNGDQTDTIYAHLAIDKSFAYALRKRTFEPDAPNYTPRISAIVSMYPDHFTYAMSLLKSADGNPNACLRFFYEYVNPLAGQGHFLHTYAKDGDPLPSFHGEPETVSLQGDIDEIGEGIWHSLHAENKVSLFVRTISIADQKTQDRIYNKL